MTYRDQLPPLPAPGAAVFDTPMYDADQMRAHYLKGFADGQAALSSQAPVDEPLLNDLAKWEAHVRRYDAEGACNPLANTLQQARAALQSRQPAAPVAAVPDATAPIKTPPPPFAVFDEFGAGCVDRIQLFYIDHSREVETRAFNRGYDAASPTPPVQPDDTRRLDWLEKNATDIHAIHDKDGHIQSFNFDADFADGTLREAIDAAQAEGGK